MKSDKLMKFIICFASISISFPSITGCSTANRVQYSSLAANEQKVYLVRTEMLIIKGDDENISRGYSVVSAVDYMQEGKKVYYLIIVPSSSSNPKMDNLKFQSDYPFVIQGQQVNDILTNLEKINNEWDSTEVKFSGAVYNLFISYPQNAVPWLEGKTRWWEEKKSFEMVPYIKFIYGKNENGSSARLSLGSRVDQIIYSAGDGKTVKGKIFVQDEEQSWVFDKSDKMKDFYNLLLKGYRDLKDKGMEGPSRKMETKAEVKAEVKPEVKPEIKPEVKTEVKPVEVKVQNKKKKKKK